MSASLRPIVIWGASGHALVLAEFLREAGYQAVAVFDNDPSRQGTSVAGLEVMIGSDGFDRWLEDWNGPTLAGIAAIGGSRGAARLEIHGRFAVRGIEAVSLQHPRGYIASTAKVGAGSQVLAHAVVGAAASVGRACIVNTAASVDHECILGDGVHIGPGATLAGCVRVDELAFVGAGAVVLPRVRIGARAIVGPGAVVTCNVPESTVVYGNPARVVRVVEDAK